MRVASGQPGRGLSGGCGAEQSCHRLASPWGRAGKGREGRALWKVPSEARGQRSRGAAVTVVTVVVATALSPRTVLTACPGGAALLLSLWGEARFFPPSWGAVFSQPLPFILCFSFIRIKRHSSLFVCHFPQIREPEKHLCVRFISTVLFPKVPFLLGVWGLSLPSFPYFHRNCLGAEVSCSHI